MHILFMYEKAWRTSAYSKKYLLIDGYSLTFISVSVMLIMFLYIKKKGGLEAQFHN